MERGRCNARGGRVGELTGKACRLGWTAQLLNGEVPQDLEEAFAEVGVALFPHRWGDLQVRCGCTDDAVPCKHIVAVLYVFARRLDEDPWLLLAWHGKDHEALLATLQRDAPNRSPPTCRPGGRWFCGPDPNRAGSPPIPASGSAGAVGGGRQPGWGERGVRPVRQPDLQILRMLEIKPGHHGPCRGAGACQAGSCIRMPWKEWVPSSRKGEQIQASTILPCRSDAITPWTIFLY